MDLTQLGKKYGTQFNFRLPNGQVIPAGVNPGQAATIDLRGVLAGVVAAPVPPEIVAIAKQLQGGGFIDPSGNFVTERTGSPEGPTPGISPIAPTIPTANFPSGRPGIYETTTGTLVNQQGQIVGVNADLSAKIAGVNTAADKSIADLIAKSGLSADDKTMFKAYYDALASFDTKKATQFAQAFASFGSTFDPYFRAKARLINDELGRNLSGLESDLNYNVDLKQRALADLQEEIKFAKDTLPIEQQNEMDDLRAKYESEAQGLAERGLSFGTRKSALEEKIRPLGRELTGSFVESSKRKFAAKALQIKQQETSATDISKEMERLREVAGQKKTGFLRGAEEKLGSTALSGFGFPTLGEIPGTLTQERIKELAGLAGFVF